MPMPFAGTTDPREALGVFRGFRCWQSLATSLRSPGLSPDALFDAVGELLELHRVPLPVEQRHAARALLRSAQAAIAHGQAFSARPATPPPDEIAASAPQT